METIEDGKEYMKTIVRNHVPNNCRSYLPTVYTAKQNISQIGIPIDLSAAAGKVIDISDDWVVVKTDRTKFFVCAKELMSTIPSLGDNVTIEPYARRGFDGVRLDAPIETVEDGFKRITFRLGDTISRLPIDKKSIQSNYLLDMIEQVEELYSPDGIRRIGQVLIDAGASQAPVAFVDAPDDQVCELPPTLKFRINTAKLNGYLSIIFDRAMDYYKLKTETLTGDQITQLDDICFVELGEQIVELVDEGNWRIARVTVTKKVAKKTAIA